MCAVVLGPLMYESSKTFQVILQASRSDHRENQHTDDVTYNVCCAIIIQSMTRWHH